LKAAELASGLGAIVLGAGLALVLPDWLRNYAPPLLVVGVVVHGLGMSLKYELSADAHPCGGSGCCFGCVGPASLGSSSGLPAAAIARQP
jgi:hypothetical protein